MTGHSANLISHIAASPRIVNESMRTVEIDLSPAVRFMSVWGFSLKILKYTIVGNVGPGNFGAYQKNGHTNHKVFLNLTKV